MHIRASRLLRGPWACLVVALLPCVADAQRQTVTIEGQSAEIAVTFGTLYFFTPGSFPGCGEYVSEPNLEPGFIGGAGFLVSPGDSPETIAANIKDGINASSVGFPATVAGNVVTILQGDAFELALSSPDMGTCEEIGTNGLRLSGCSINNLANVVQCDETSAHVSGYRAIGGTLAGTPALPPWAFAASLLFVAGAGVWVLGRRTSPARA